jgi:hypothetical protein
MGLSALHNRTRVLVSIIVLSLFLAVFSLPPILAVDSTGQDQETKLNFLNSTFNAANASLAETLSNLQSKGVIIPQASMATFQEAQSLFSQSGIACEQGADSQVISLTIQALGKIKETLTSLNRTITETTTTKEAADQLIVQLRSQVDRGLTMLQDYEAIAARATEKGMNMTAISQEIEAAKSDLVSAALSLSSDSVSQAQNKIDQAQVMIDQLTAYFNSFAITLKQDRITRYLNVAEQDLENLEAEYASMSSQLSSDAQAATSAAIADAQNSLNAAKQVLSSSQASLDSLTAVKTSVAAVTSYVVAVSPTPTPTPTPTPAATASATSCTNAATATAKSTSKP